MRPFGVALMIAGKNDNETKLYTSDITGNYFEYNAIAIGENDEKIKEILRKEYKPEITINEAIKLALKIFKDFLKDNFDISRFNVGIIKKQDTKLEKLSFEEIKKLM